jgi:hypothetical protein
MALVIPSKNVRVVGTLYLGSGELQEEILPNTRIALCAVIPAQAGIQKRLGRSWTPAFAGVTNCEWFKHYLSEYLQMLSMFLLL